jgi:hypothetical protein
MRWPGTMQRRLFEVRALPWVFFFIEMRPGAADV